jgi:hypothetical protein
MKKLLLGLILVIIILTTVPLALADRPPIVPENIGNELIIPSQPTDQQNIPQEQYFGGVLLPIITRTVIMAAGGLAVLFIIVGGIQILTAYGSDEKIGAAKKTITYAVVGLLISILSYAIVTIISSIKL